jgi:hypothetical protein
MKNLILKSVAVFTLTTNISNADLQIENKAEQVCNILYDE